MSEAEINSRCEITLDNYCKTIVIEANTMVNMARCEIAPAVEEYITDMAKTASLKKSIDSNISVSYESNLVKKLSDIMESIYKYTDELENETHSISSIDNVIDESAAIRDTLLATMDNLRAVCDEAETLTAKKYWPFPTYGELLFSVK